MKYRVQLKFPVTNNKAEYKAILTGLKVAQALGAKIALLKSDSQLIIRPINGEFEVTESRM